MMTVFPDSDFDGYGVGASMELCAGDAVPPGWSATGDDCDDANATVYPSAPEIPDDGKANACAGQDLVAATASGVFVKPGNSDMNEGTREAPLGTLVAALAKAAQTGAVHIFVAQGRLDESLVLDRDVALHGGYDPANWTRATLKTRLVGAGPVAVGISDAKVSMDAFEVFGFQNEGDGTPHPDVTGIRVEGGQAVFTRSTIGGGTLDASMVEGTGLSTTGIRVIDSRVTVVGSQVGSGSPRALEWSGSGRVERTARGTGILVESGRVVMVGGTLGFFAEAVLHGVRGVAVARARARGLEATGGEALLVGLDIDGSANAETDDTAEEGVLARAETLCDTGSIEVSGDARVWVINSVVAAGQAKALSEVWVQGAAGQTAAAEGDARVIAASVRAGGGLLDVIHCDLHTDRFSEAVADLESTGSKVGTTHTSIHMVRAEAGGRMRVVNSAGYNQVLLDDSALVFLDPASHLSLVKNVLWDQGFDACRVHDGTDCRVVEGGLEGIAVLPGCDTAVGNRVEDPLWGWWDTVQTGSPLRDQGIDPATLGLGVPVDLDGAPRPQGAGFDIGAYEFAPL
jgi:hypothetical protein